GLNAIITSADRFPAALCDRGGTRIASVTDVAPIRRQMPLFPVDGDDELGAGAEAAVVAPPPPEARGLKLL
ncbi:MAG: hypothetical protein U1F43_20320, partial [Myxococcota bacterium]